MAVENKKIQKITGDSYDDCKKQLWKLYGANYHEEDVQHKPVRYGLFKQKQKYVTELYFTTGQTETVAENNYSKEADQFEKNRQAILMNTQYKQMSAQIQDLKDEMQQQLSHIVVSNQEKHESIKKIDELLEMNEFTPSFIEEIEEKIRNNFSIEQLNNFDLVESRVVDWIGDSIEIAKQKTFRPPHVVIIVGPTGVGKTTTLVKLAAQFVISFKREGRKAEICFISTDSMRVGAMEQLSRWGEIMEYKVLKAETTDDLKTLYDSNRDAMDAIFIDTSGYSPNDAAHIGIMKSLLDIPGMNPDVYLAMTASTKARDLSNIMQNYEPFGYNSVIITKCDESEQIGNVISMLHKKHKAISFITNGQKASANILRVNEVDLLTKLEGFKIDRKHIEDTFGVK